ncbi:hypothetical protein PVAP13_4KG137000 [Panicum virgatum]|uniref:DUF4220 domain-containing protein n=1 Tax=Panicum virgatum TaxID=38727 RepID=A0A8T0TNA4_PANVG|nr:hypothetical protein PVAP13_4KG137000 [Panicum virgatum]
MAADDMDCPPGSPPQDCGDGADYRESVAALIVEAIVAMFLLHILGSLRRRSSNICTLSYPLVSYTIGRMNSSYWYNDDFTHLFKGFLLVYVLWTISGRHLLPYMQPLLAILFIVVLKWYLRMASLRMVSMPYLCKNMKVINEYMQHKDNLLAALDPVTMEGYRYMVAGEKCWVMRPGCRPWYKEDGLKVTTVEQIWQCKGNLLFGERGMVLKDVCLSMALSKMLNRRFAGFKLSESELEKTHDFVFKGLLAGDKQYQRAFRVTDEDLVFVHDMYYTRYSYLYQKGRYFALCLPVIMFALCSWLTCLLVKYTDMGYRTIFITIVLALLEAYQLYLYIASGWFKVVLIRSYVDTPFLQRRGHFLEKIIGLLLRLKAFRSWNSRLGQYCILQDLAPKSWVRNCLHYATLRLVDKANKRKNSSEKLSENVKKAIVDSLLGSNGHLRNGVTSLQNNGVRGYLLWASRTILVWHIATILCHHQLDEQTKEEDTVRTASTLSQYCLHLLAFAPNLLPDHSSISESLLDQSIDEARELLKGAKTLESKCEKLMGIISTHDADGGETPIVVHGAQLARHLIEDIQEPTLRWKVISDFCAEMMLYVSPSDDARAHLEALARGGEFITHLWALLTHARVLKRGPTGQDDVV